MKKISIEPKFSNSMRMPILKDHPKSALSLEEAAKAFGIHAINVEVDRKKTIEHIKSHLDR